MRVQSQSRCFALNTPHVTSVLSSCSSSWDSYSMVRQCRQNGCGRHRTCHAHGGCSRASKSALWTRFPQQIKYCEFCYHLDYPFLDQTWAFSRRAGVVAAAESAYVMVSGRTVLWSVRLRAAVLAHHIERLCTASPGASSVSRICHVATAHSDDDYRQHEHDNRPHRTREDSRVGSVARRTQLLAELHERSRRLPPPHTRNQGATSSARTRCPADAPGSLQMGPPGAYDQYSIILHESSDGPSVAAHADVGNDPARIALSFCEEEG